MFYGKGSEEPLFILRKMIVAESKLERRAEDLHESNPMMGHRGVRLGVTFPEISEMQFRAIFESTVELRKDGKTVLPEIMVPVVGIVAELENQKAIATRVLQGARVHHCRRTHPGGGRPGSTYVVTPAKAGVQNGGTDAVSRTSHQQPPFPPLALGPGFRRDDDVPVLPAALTPLLRQLCRRRLHAARPSRGARSLLRSYSSRGERPGSTYVVTPAKAGVQGGWVVRTTHYPLPTNHRPPARPGSRLSPGRRNNMPTSGPVCRADTTTLAGQAVVASCHRARPR
jgi:hypothetical protein